MQRQKEDLVQRYVSCVKCQQQLATAVHIMITTSNIPGDVTYCTLFTTFSVTTGFAKQKKSQGFLLIIFGLHNLGNTLRVNFNQFQQCK